MLNMFTRSIIIYIFVLGAIRFMGKRQVGEMQPFEFVITLIVADLATIPMSEISIPILHGLIPMFSIVILHFFICFISQKSMKARYIISGRPAIVINPDGIDFKELKKLNMNLDDLIEALRGNDIFEIDTVAYAILETNGKLCTVLKPEYSPVTREDMKLSPKQIELPVNIIMDGKIMDENLKLLNIDHSFVDELIETHNEKSIKNILLLTMDTNGKVFMQPKFSKALTFNSNYKGDTV